MGLRLPERRLRLLQRARRRRSRRSRTASRRASTTCSRSTIRWSFRSNKKIRLLITSSDVIHAWYVPAVGVQAGRDSRASCATTGCKFDKTGTYRGQCAKICGKEHGFMPIVVEVEVRRGLRRRGSASRRRSSPPRPTIRTRRWTLQELIARGEKVYAANCAACHQANGKGMPPRVSGARRLEGRRPGRRSRRSRRC